MCTFVTSEISNIFLKDFIFTYILLIENYTVQPISEILLIQM